MAKENPDSPSTDLDYEEHLEGMSPRSDKSMSPPPNTRATQTDTPPKYIYVTEEKTVTLT